MTNHFTHRPCRSPHRTAKPRAKLLAIVSLTVATGLLLGCASKERWRTEDPKEAARLFLAALYYHNDELAFRFLPNQTQQALEKRATAINTAVGSKTMQGSDLISSVGAMGTHLINRIDIDQKASADQDTRETRTHLVVKMHTGEEFPLEMIQEDGVWRVASIALP